jgi:predicted PurR-regulated permease PerM
VRQGIYQTSPANGEKMKVKRWLAQKTFRNWAVILLAYLLLSGLFISVMLTRDLVRDIKGLENTITQYQDSEATYQNSINLALDTIQKLKNK